MQTQPFETLLDSSLLTSVEREVVQNHATLHRDVLGEDWSEPTAYQWLRYESRDPVARLLEGMRRLLAEWRVVSASDERLHTLLTPAVDAERMALGEALRKARMLGYGERE